MNPIRPAGYPVPPPVNAQADAARLAAQKAFFQAALGRAAPTPSAAPPAPVAAAPAMTAARAPAAAQAADSAPKLLRPGSLLDIRV